jgi:hypothetical protein
MNEAVRMNQSNDGGTRRTQKKGEMIDDSITRIILCRFLTVSSESAAGPDDNSSNNTDKNRSCGSVVVDDERKIRKHVSPE